MKQEHTEDSVPDVSHISNVDVAHEVSDVNVGLIFKFVVALAVLMVISLGLMKLTVRFFEGLEQRAEKSEPVASELAKGEDQGKKSEDLVKEFPEPRLQTTPVPDLQTYQKQVDEALKSYGWADQSAGKARIPIAEAKRIVLEKGLLNAPQQPAPAAGAAPPPAAGQPNPAAPRPAPRAAAAPRGQ